MTLRDFPAGIRDHGEGRREGLNFNISGNLGKDRTALMPG
ncbi:hypothetical protein SAMN04487894_101327 [Niabella drilacis]|uniref:Uncharacterized protein n=1 Tax=Niabella drilacis (strain DSM 25811 / CCM 8410 / CCUG 62505 / LMG 26954 / E90) TaxID=1285928 RepID=A0A1G6IU09_NIADE|nr:hypothetical protein SAMN04487894_101327 [Niabella drilacis]